MPALRITGGTLRGRRIPLPPHDLRPTSERARQAFFNIVGDRIQECRFLDLFAGTGVFSFEAVSRGATEAVAVDKSSRAVREIAGRAAEWRVRVRTVASDALVALRRLSSEEFGLIWADPPYDYSKYAELVHALDADARLAPGALVAVEHRSGAPLPEVALERLGFRRTVEYGSVAISLYEMPEER